MTIRPSFISLLLLFGLLVSCTSSGSGRSRQRRSTPVGGGSIWERLEASRANSAERVRLIEAMDASVRDLPEGWKYQIDGWWRLWVKNDDGWPDARRQWVQLGEGAENILVENLIRWYVFAFAANRGSEQQRARVEILNHKRAAAPYLVEGLRTRAGDDVVRNLCSDLLADFGADMIPAVEDAYDDADWRGQWALLRVLKQMREPTSVPFLARVATGSGRFETRIEALEAMGKIGDRRAMGAFRECLRDDDPSVRKFAAHYISAFKDASRPVLESLVGCMEAANNRGEGEIVRACQRSLSRLMRVNLGARPAAWRNAINARGGI